MIQLKWDTANSSVEEPATAMAHEIRDELVATSGYNDLAVYVNYANGDETLEQIYGAEKMPRLATLKKKYDPENVFGFNNPLPTAYP